MNKRINVFFFSSLVVFSLFSLHWIQIPGNPKKPCELCYCIRNMTSCVMQECTLHVDGCRPIYNKGVCCPVRYDCGKVSNAFFHTCSIHCYYACCLLLKLLFSQVIKFSSMQFFLFQPFVSFFSPVLFRSFCSFRLIRHVQLMMTKSH